jgi:two-component system nitrogen regulation response regulator NtrX
MTQAKVLRILQEQSFVRVGGTKTLDVDVRVVAATNKDLTEEMKNGSFREDLYYRLNVLPFRVPPLRERVEDIATLARTFVENFCEESGSKPKKIAPAAMKLLQAHTWPGNVRELRNLMERLVIMCPVPRCDDRRSEHSRYAARVAGKGGRWDEYAGRGSPQLRARIPAVAPG